MSILCFHFIFSLLPHNPIIRKRHRERASEEEERRGSGFSAALYPNPGFENRMRRTQVSTNTSNYSTDMELEGGGEELDGK